MDRPGHRRVYGVVPGSARRRREHDRDRRRRDLDTTSTGANPGYPTLAMHRYSASEKGELQHYIDENLRATVPPEGWDDYVKILAGVDRRSAAAPRGAPHQASGRGAASQARMTPRSPRSRSGSGHDRRGQGRMVRRRSRCRRRRACSCSRCTGPDGRSEVQRAIDTLRAKGLTISSG